MQNSPKDEALTHLDYLEVVESPETLKFALKNNAYSDERLKSDSRYTPTFETIFKIVSAKDKLPAFYLLNNQIYNFWQDNVHIKGILRRSSIEKFNANLPNWQTVLDVDLLAKKEKKNWVYKGMICLEPAYERCLVSLSDGGKDARVMREFNLKKLQFVVGGFVIPESKSSAVWLNRDSLLIGDATDPATLTPAGNPSQIKVLKRKGNLKTSDVVFKCDRICIAADVGAVNADGERYFYVGNQISFFEGEVFLLDIQNSKLIRIPIPTTANFEGIFKTQILFSNRDTFNGFAAGSLLSMPISDLESYKPRVNSVFKPTEISFYELSARSKNHLFIEVLNDVKKKVLKSDFVNDNWVSEPVMLGDANGNESIASLDPTSTSVYMNYADFLTPTSVYYRDEAGKAANKVILHAPARFNSEGFSISQYKTKSKDGTLVPYFVVAAKNLKLNSENPTLLYGYGGFEIPMTSAYLGQLGKVWLEKGGVYVLANIRGGGEYGPAWHQAALRENRHKAYEDFYAIAEDLIQRKITQPKHLGIKGGSNGGLLTSVALTQRPDLFGAVISEVPLTNMLEYHKWLAGSSWVEEYGNPEDPKMREYLKSYSPLHNLSRDKKYPEAFFLTSTKDDRVSPAHARQMVARMQELGLSVLYNENTEGGHGRATNMKDLAEYLALEYTYLYQKLF